MIFTRESEGGHMSRDGFFKRLFISLLLLAMVACQNGEMQKPEPPTPPSQQELERRFKKSAEGKWVYWSHAQFVYDVQKYCAYITDECATEHLWLGEWGYAFPSYRTIVYHQAITIPGIYHIAMSQKECPSIASVYTYQRITGQGVYNTKGEMIHYFCVKKILNFQVQ